MAKAAADWKSRLKASQDSDKEARLKALYGSLTREVALIPEGTRTQYPVLLDARQLHAIRLIARERGSVQRVLRDAVDHVITTYFATAITEKLVRGAPKKKPKKRAPRAKSAKGEASAPAAP